MPAFSCYRRPKRGGDFIILAVNAQRVIQEILLDRAVPKPAFFSYIPSIFESLGPRGQSFAVAFFQTDAGRPLLPRGILN